VRGATVVEITDGIRKTIPGRQTLAAVKMTLERFGGNHVVPSWAAGGSFYGLCSRDR